MQESLWKTKRRHKISKSNVKLRKHRIAQTIKNRILLFQMNVFWTILDVRKLAKKTVKTAMYQLFSETH